MGGCLSTQCCEYKSVVSNSAVWPFGGGGSNRSNRRNLHDSTFTHYSLTSETSILDLYPTLGYEDQQHRDPPPCSVCDIDWGGGGAAASYRFTSVISDKTVVFLAFG